jgi:hypothetical protein
MAQLFPTHPAGAGGDAPRSWLIETLLALPDPWTLLADRQIGAEEEEGAEAIDVVLVHPEIGVALVDAAPRDPAGVVAAFRDYLDAQRFGEFYPGELPIVALSIALEEIAEIGDRLAAAFEAAPRLAIADGDWADAVIEVLLTPADLPMAPVHEAIPEEPIPEPAPSSPAAAEEAPQPVPELPAERPLDMPRLDSPAPPLMAEWPFALHEEAGRRWQFGRLAVAAAALLLFCGLGLAAWNISQREEAPSEAMVTPGAVEAPVPQPEASAPTMAEAPTATPAPPPPVPPAQPVILAAKPLAPPPPLPPKPTRVEPLPQIAANDTPPPPAPTPAPAPAPAQAASPPLPPAPAAPAPAQAASPSPPAPTQATAPPAPAPPRAAPPRPAPPPPAVRSSAPPRSVAAAAPRPAREARLTPARRRRAEPEAERGPPIDATDLPPLEPEPRAAPQAPGLGIAAAAQAAAPPAQRECRPYTADTPLAGRGVAVQGIACRDADGAWRLVSEVPLR